MIPDVTGLEYDELTTADGQCYMRRYYLERTRQGEKRYHHILMSDQDRDMHDHPWNFQSTILHGSYLETTPDGANRYQAGDIITRTAGQPHRLELTEPVWTYIKTGPFVKTWGFHTPNGWVDWRRYRATPSRNW